MTSALILVVRIPHAAQPDHSIVLDSSFEAEERREEIRIHGKQSEELLAKMANLAAKNLGDCMRTKMILLARSKYLAQE